MENLGKGTGNVAVDGAFERFLTAAIATIITIMFSWRLLAEENENFGEMPPGGIGRTIAVMDGGPRNTDEGEGNNQNTKIDKSTSDKLGSDCTVPSNSSDFGVDGDSPGGDISCQLKSEGDVDDEVLDYQSSWADYDPDEDMYGSVHTRRSARDFITGNKERNKDRYSFSDSDTEVSENMVPSSHELLEQLYVNKEYSSILDSDRYVDINDKIEDSSESESESEEGEFEPPMIDSDEEPYYPSVLEPIIEEDSDDSVTTETEISKSSVTVELKSPSFGPHHVSPETFCQGGHSIPKSGSDVTIEVNSNTDDLTHVQLFTSESFSDSKVLKDENETSEYNNFESKSNTKPSPLEIVEIENQNNDNIEMVDSLPASPIRTCAVDDDRDGYFSDESCSSESVVTVVSLRSYERNKMNEFACLDSHEVTVNETSIKNEELVETCVPLQENINNTGRGPDQIKEDIIAFIHGIENRPLNHSTEQNSGSSDLNAIVDTNVIDRHDSGLTTFKNVTEPPVTCDNHKNQGIEDLQNIADTTVVENISKNVGITYNDFVSELESSSETVQKTDVSINEHDSPENDDNFDATQESKINGIIYEQDEDSPSPLNKSLENIELTEEIYNHVGQSPVDEDSDEEPREYTPDEPREYNSDEPREYNSDEPREYNPDEDDFARFNSDFDSDEDSFYLLIGGNDNLRKLETFTNLDVVGLSSPGAYSSDETSYVDENEKKIVFSRTEEVVTEHSVKCYVKNRESSNVSEFETEIENKKTELKNEQNIKFNKSFEEEQQKILSDIEQLLESESDTENVLNVENEQVKSDIHSGTIDQLDSVHKILTDQISEITNINSTSTDIDRAVTYDIPEDVSHSNQTVLENESAISQDSSIENKCVSRDTAEYPLVSEQIELSSRDSSENGSNQQPGLIEISNSKNNLSNKDISYSKSHINKSLNKDCEIRSLFNDDSEQRLPSLQEDVSTDSIKPTFIDSKNSEDLKSVALNNIDNDKFPDTKTYLNETTLPNPVTIQKHVEQKSQWNINEEKHLENLNENNKANIDGLNSTGVTKTNSGLGIDLGSENAGDINKNRPNFNSINGGSKDVDIIVELEKSIQPCIEILSNATQTGETNYQGFDSKELELSSKENDNQTEKAILTDNEGSRDISSRPALSRVVQTPLQRPSGYKGGVRGRISKQLQYKPKLYSSVLQQPIIVETHRSLYADSPTKDVPKCRQKILVSRKRFLSEENLSTLPNTFKDQFTQHKTSLTNTTPRQRRYIRRDRNTSVQARKNLSFDRIDRLRDLCSSPRISDDSFEKPEIDHLHADCIFSPQKHEQIMNTTFSIDNLQAHLLRYGSVTSLVETDIDSGETFETRVFPETDIDDFEFQVPLQRTASMSDIAIKKKSERRGRFADRNVPKSKSLQTLETNIDDVFTAEGQGNLTRVPSVHELRVTKSLSKLNVPDWYKKSSVSRSGSTFSLYSGRRDSTSTMSSFGYPPSLTSSPCPSVTPGSNAVVIKTRVTPSSAKLIRAPKLPTTPEKSPIPPSILKLPSDKFRQKEKPKDLMPIPIVPFAKLRLMFESKGSKSQSKSKSSDNKSSSSATKSPTSPEVPPQIKQDEIIVPQNRAKASLSPTSSTDNYIKHTESVTNGRIANNIGGERPRVPEKPTPQPANKAPHCNTEPSTLSENNSKNVRYSIPSQSRNLPVQNTQVSNRLVLPKAVEIAQSQSRKGNVYDFNDNITSQSCADEYVNLQGELLFDFLQKLRYSRLQENVFSDQLPSNKDMEDNGQHYRFPILSVNQHSPGLDQSRDVRDTGNLQVVFTDTSLNGDNNFSNLNETSLEEVLSGLLALNEKKKSLSRVEEGQVSRKISDESQASLSPPWWTGPIYRSVSSESDKSITIDTLNYYDDVFHQDENFMVRCKHCKHESPLQNAKLSYKTCHHCFTYYCSRNCRQSDWEKHKRKCLLSRINSLCKRVIKYVNRDTDTQYHFSRAARRGYLSQGRGCLILAFSDLECAENFMVQGVHSLWLPPVFLSVNNLSDASMLQDSVQTLVEMCTCFNPELKFVLHVVIPTPGNLPQKPMPRKRLSLVQKTAKLRLSPAHMHPELKENEESSTLILTAVPGGPDVNSTSERKSREVCFVHIQRKLRERGVSLRHHYPNVYDKLIEYVANAKHFAPLIIYPYDKRIGKLFMCVIMPESEPEIEWVQERTLLDELDITEDFCRKGVFSLSLSSLEDIPETPV